jgi:hypothetical protein
MTLSNTRVNDPFTRLKTYPVPNHPLENTVSDDVLEAQKILSQTVF